MRPDGDDDETLTSLEPYGYELWACGFNAWGQLDFDGDERNMYIRERTEAKRHMAHEDYREWKKILVDKKEIEFIRGGYHSVLGEFCVLSWIFLLLNIAASMSS